jgi:hypothetical protein
LLNLCDRALGRQSGSQALRQKNHDEITANLADKLATFTDRISPRTRWLPPQNIENNPMQSSRRSPASTL